MLDRFAVTASRMPFARAAARLALVARNQSRLLVRRGRRGAASAIKAPQAWARRWNKAGAGLLARTGRRFSQRSDRWRPGLQIASERLVNQLGYFNLSYRVPGERRSCPACGSGDLKQLDVLWQLRRDAARSVGFMSGLPHVRLVFANPLPTAEELAAYYAPDSDYVDRRWRRPVASAAPAPAPTAAHAAAVAPVERPEKQDKLSLLFASVAPYLDVLHPPADARVLDYGCGPGRVLDRLKPAGWETFGIEPALKTAFARHAELVTPPPEPTFHLVIVHHVLEHLLNPLDVLRQIAASMVDGGIIYISVPRLDAIDRHGDLRYCINSHGHVMSYTRECMTALLAMAGLDAIDVQNDAELDGLLTNGEPRRLRVFARKGPTAVIPAAPLAAAERALRGYRARFEPASTSGLAALPVRLRAGWLHRARTATMLAHRSHKLNAR